MLHCKQLKMICVLGKGTQIIWDGRKSPSSKTSIFDNRNNTVEALINDYLGNSDKWLQLELAAYENGFYHKAYVLTTSVAVIILNKLSFLLPITEAAH